jgi:hypothetical protein
MALIKLNNKAVSNATAFGSISSLGSMVFIKKLTASSSATLSFVDGTDGVVLDDTYKEYVFTFNNIHPASEANFTFNLSTDGGSNYNVTKTTTMFHAFMGGYGNETVTYYSSADLAQSTAFQQFSAFNIWNNDKAGLTASMSLFNPSSTTFVKHFIARCSSISGGGSYANDSYLAGYGNTTSAVDAIRFQMSSGNIDAGDICLYGIA